MNDWMKRVKRVAVGLGLVVTAGLLQADIFVATNGLDSNTGADWSQPVASLTNAVNKVGLSGTVWVSNGVYTTSAEVLITNGITVASMNGAGLTTVQGLATNYRIFRVTNPSAVLDGFTVAKGGVPSADKKGAGIYMTAGLVRNCIVSNNTPTNSAVWGGGVYLQGGLMTNCVVRDNFVVSGLGTGVYITNAIMMNCVINNNGSGTQNNGVQGAGVYLAANGIVSNCVIQRNLLKTTGASGAGVYMTGGKLQNSMVVGNGITGGTGANGGGIGMSGGRVENSLIASNWSTGGSGGGGVLMTGGTVVNCTIVANRDRGSGLYNTTASGMGSSGAGVQWGFINSSGGWTVGGGTITNCIIYNNMRFGSQAQINVGGSAGFSNAFFSCCSPDLVSGTNGNITAEPQFVDWKNGDFNLLPYSPCVDTGTNVAAGVDVNGTPRPQDGRGSGAAKVDMGAYERIAANSAFNCYFQAQTNEAFNSLAALFTARVFGPNTNGLYYWWNFGDGTQEGADLGSVTHTYATVGTYSVSLAVSNELGAVTNWSIPNYIRVGAPFAYVATNGAHVSPFDTWSKAATSILAAVNAAVVTTGGSTRVIVSNGTYNVSTSTASIFISRGITVSSLNGAATTLVWGIAGNDVYPNFDLDHPDAVLDGFSSENANFGVTIHRGTVRNCIFRNNSGNSQRPNGAVVGSNYGGLGAGVCMYGGLVDRCEIVSNQVASTGASGAGVFMTGGGIVQNCTIAFNKQSGSGGVGGGVLVFDFSQRATLRNCLVYSNEVGVVNNTGGGGGVGLNGGRVENCTIVSNNISHTTGVGSGGGIQWLSGTSVNTIVYYNTLYTSSVNNVSGASLVPFSYSCATELPDGVRGCITADPQVVSVDRKNFRLTAASPCVNAGTNLSWMDGATDLDGHTRRSGSQPDMGAYETRLGSGVIIILR